MPFSCNEKVCVNVRDEELRVQNETAAIWESDTDLLQSDWQHKIKARCTTL